MSKTILDLSVKVIGVLKAKGFWVTVYVIIATLRLVAECYTLGLTSQTLPTSVRNILDIISIIP